MGTVYLIHFDRPYKHAQHYLGWTPGALSVRIAKHRHGNGAALMHAVTQAGIGWRVVRVIEGDHAEEQRLHRYHKSSRLCPICNPHVARDTVCEMLY